MIHPVLYTPTHPDTTGRKPIFKGRCSIRWKVFCLVIDLRNLENLISKRVVELLQLQTMPLLELNTLEWFKKRPREEVTQKCMVPLSMGRLYQHDVACNIVDMDYYYVLGNMTSVHVTTTSPISIRSPGMERRFGWCHMRWAPPTPNGRAGPSFWFPNEKLTT